ncbi:MAG: methyltransferase, partial [Spirochaetales bacterium]|nr:methyltransferase [Spirochaetales bacterium]
EWYISLASRKDYIHAIFARQTDIALENLRSLYREVGDAIDVLFLCGTDFGTQTSSFCSTDTYRELYMPYYQRMTSWIHGHTRWKTFKHSCGAVFNFVPLFIESGFDILNPVQLSAAGMDAVALKKEYGKDIVFWGGGVDTQKTLPFGTPEDVRSEVLTRLQIFSGDAGYVFNTIHNIQAKTPVENVIAMIDAVHEFNGR